MFQLPIRLLLFICLISGPAWGSIQDEIHRTLKEQSSLEATPVTVGQMSGIYSDPAHDGEGFVVEVLDASRAVIYWFTYDATGNQRWFIADGRIENGGIDVAQWITTRGARFGDAFDPEQVEYRSAGGGRFDFIDCNSMKATYTIDGQAGQQDLVRLTGVADIDCTQLKSHRSGLSGSFFDAQRSGEGLVLQAYGINEAVAFFFTYNQAGEQMWVLGLGHIDGSQLVLVDPFTTSGGRFGPDFEPADIEQIPWGGLSLQLGCNLASLTFEPLNPALAAGGLDMVRLSTLAGLTCDAGATFTLQPLACGNHGRSFFKAAVLDSLVPEPIAPNSQFTPPADCAPALHELHGSLKFQGGDILVEGSVDKRQKVFPSIEFDLVTVGDYLVPVQPGVLRGENYSDWELVLGNGRIWSEEADGGRSRAVLPFTLSQVQWNEAHQGLMTFLYDDTSVSRVHFQVTQENVPWCCNFNYRAALDVVFEPGRHQAAYTVERAFRRDMAMRLPVRPLQELADMTGINALSSFNRGLVPSDISQAGIVMDHTLYLQPATTRSGSYPYPEEMRHGAFSVSKTAGAAVALLRLAQKYGDSVFDELIRDHIEVTASHDGWQDVTFGHALSMVTGVGDAYPTRSASVTFADESDEENPHWRTFNYSTFMSDRLAGAFSFDNYPWGPGEVMRYNSAQTMILAVAMDNYLKSKEGPEADLWKMLNQEVYQPIGIRWLPSMRLRINQNTPGPVPLGWGLIVNPHDVSRIAALLHNHGEFQGQQLLHRERTIQAMRNNQDFAYETAEWTQLVTNRWVPTQYRDGIWSSGVDPTGGCGKIASRMEGVGGNFVVMMPSGLTLFRFADANVYDAGALILVGERIRSSCGN